MGAEEDKVERKRLAEAKNQRIKEDKKYLQEKNEMMNLNGNFRNWP
jgi:hypothetical protein